MGNDKIKRSESMGKQRKQDKRTPSTQEPGVTNNHNMKNIPDLSYDPQMPNNSGSSPKRFKAIAPNTMIYKSGYLPPNHHNPSMTNQPNLTYSSIMTDTKDATNNVTYIYRRTDLGNPSMTNQPSLIYKPYMPRNTGSPDMTYTANAKNFMHDNTVSPYIPQNSMVNNPNNKNSIPLEPKKKKKKQSQQQDGRLSQNLGPPQDAL